MNPYPFDYYRNMVSYFERTSAQVQRSGCISVCKVSPMDLFHNGKKSLEQCRCGLSCHSSESLGQTHMYVQHMTGVLHGSQHEFLGILRSPVSSLESTSRFYSPTWQNASPYRSSRTSISMKTKHTIKCADRGINASM